LNHALGSATNREDVENLSEAISKLDGALDPDLWMPDGNHLVCNQGDSVFNRYKDAVQKLMEMIRDTSTPAISDATIQNWINTLVAIDRDLAQTAIMEANVPGVDPKKIAKALQDLATGDADAARGDFDKAIEDYRKTWNGVKGCNN